MRWDRIDIHLLYFEPFPLVLGMLLASLCDLFLIPLGLVALAPQGMVLTRAYDHHRSGDDVAEHPIANESFILGVSAFFVVWYVTVRICF